MRRTIEREEVLVRTEDADLEGSLVMPAGAQGVVLFAHGSGSSRKSPRNGFVAEILHEGGFGTLLFDLLTTEEGRRDERTGELRFDVPLLGRRLGGAVEWTLRHPAARGRPIGLFGASTGSAAALLAAAGRADAVGAVVSRGGRPDLASEALPHVAAPTLLIVGGRDEVVLKLNRKAAERLYCEHRIAIVPGATHLFEEPGALEAVARLARDWFAEHLGGTST